MPSIMEPIMLFGAPDCKYCVKAKELLDEMKVKYMYVNVREDKKARDWMIEKTEQMSIPVIFAGSEVIIGFNGNEDKIRALCQ